MRSSTFRILVCFISFTVAASSFAEPQKGAGKGRAVKQDQSEKPPFVGMTKAQAISRYGEPKTRSVTNNGEQWTYVLNYGEAIGKAFIPFNFRGTALRTGVLNFGANGKVKDFRWDAESKD